MVPGFLVSVLVTVLARKYRTIWVSVSDLNQNGGFGRALMQRAIPGAIQVSILAQATIYALKVFQRIPTKLQYTCPIITIILLQVVTEAAHHAHLKRFAHFFIVKAINDKTP